MDKQFKKNKRIHILAFKVEQQNKFLKSANSTTLARRFHSYLLVSRVPKDYALDI